MEKTAIDIINEGKEKFNLLKINSENFDICSILELASKIREDISNDQEIQNACNVNEECARLRKNLLDDIREYQKCLIEQNTKQREKPSFSNSHIIDFDRAKAAMVEMIDSELNKNLFNDTEEPPLFANIEDCGTHIERLHQVSDNCKYGRYNVLIMGDFQSGKSTTLDALCDGRHISAIGQGTATSAVLVSVTYAEKESMIVKWRTKEQFKKVFEKIQQYLPNYIWNDFDIDDKNKRRQLADEIENLRTSKNCPNVGEGDAKFLMLCDFVLKYYGSSELKEKQSTLQSIRDIPSMTKFPENGETTWQKSGLKEFKIDDVVFVFVEAVDCFVPSNTLRELNCTIVDSPGLFNSSYDTMVTEGAMVKAHAIMYVLPYHKGMGQDICKSLYTIKDKYPDVHRKLLVINNLQTGNGAFYESNCKQVQSMFGSDKEVPRYDAKLSYLAMLKKLYDSERAIENDYHHLLNVTIRSYIGDIKKEFKGFKEAWTYQVRKYGFEELGMDLEDTNLILKVSEFPNLTTILKQFIAKNESYAVIVSNGLAPMWHDLMSVRNSLNKSYIEPYNTKREKLIKKWQKRIENAEKFQVEVTKTTKAKLYEDTNPLFERMVNEEYKKIFTYDFYTNLSEAIAGVLYDNKGTLLVTKTVFENKSLFEQRFSKLAYSMIERKITEYINPKMLYLINMIEGGQDTTVVNLFTPITDIINMKLLKVWDELYKDDGGFCMQDYLCIPKGLGKSEMNNAYNNNHDINELSGSYVDMTLLGGLVCEISAIVAGLATMISGIIATILCDPTLISQILAAILGLGGAIIAIIAPKMYRNYFVSHLSEKIQPKLYSEAVVGFRKLISYQVKNMFDRYIANLKVNIKKMENERDLALRPTPNQEQLCFRAVEATINIDSQIDAYDDYKQNNIKDEAV